MSFKFYKARLYLLRFCPQILEGRLEPLFYYFTGALVLAIICPSGGVCRPKARLKTTYHAPQRSLSIKALKAPALSW